MFNKSATDKKDIVATREKNLILQFIILVVTWAAFFTLPFQFFPYNRSYSPFDSQRFVTSLIVSNIVCLGFYFVNGWILIPNILAKKKTFLYVLIVLASFFFYLSVMNFIAITSPETKEFLKYAAEKDIHLKGPTFFSSGPMTLFLLAFVISTGSKVISEWFSAEEVKEEIKRQQLQTELSLLKSQVNPHFLFNTLNSIYSLSVSNSKRTSDAVMKLSHIMRYTLEESQKDFVMLQQEIDFINSYIELQKLRLTDNTQIQFVTCGSIGQVMIAPLLFIPFIENAFKYGISAHHVSDILVELKVENNTLYFKCKNNGFPKGSMAQKSTGTGIINTRRRLELLYNKKHDLNISSIDKEFNVSLTINLQS